MATADISPHSNAPANVQSGSVLRDRLGVLTRRRNAQQLARHLIRAAIPGLGLAAISVALYRLHIVPDGPVWAPAALIGASLLWGARNGFLARRGHFAAASDADKALKLDDRLSSALAFVAPGEIRRTARAAAPAGKLGRLKSVLLPRNVTSSAPTAPATHLVPALVGEASARAVSLDPRAVYPLRFDRPAQVFVLCAALFVGSLFLPDVPILMGAQQKQERQAIMKEGEKLVAVAKQIRKEEKPDETQVAQLNNKLEKLGKKMARGRLTKRAALTEIGELKKKLEDAQKPGNQSQSGSMPQIPEALKQTPLQSEVGRKVQQKLQENKWDEAAKELDKLADRLDKGQVSRPEQQQIANDLDKLAKDLENRGGAANQEAAQKLKDAAQQLRQEPPQNQPSPPQGQPNQQQNGGQNQQTPPQGDGKKSGQQGQNQPDPQQQQGKEGQQGQDGKSLQGQGKQGQQGNKGQSPQGQTKQGQQSQSGQGKSPQGQGKQGQQGSQGKSPQGQGKQGQSGGQGGQSGQGQQGQSGASGAMRDMANGLRQGQGGGSGNMGEMLDKLRQAENGANGQGQMGQGNSSAGGRTFGSKGEMGNMITPGKDLKPTDPHGMVGGGPGLGPRNNAQGVNSGGGVSDKKSRRTGDKRRYQDAWADQLPATQKQLSKIKGKWGGGGEVEQLPTKGEAKGGQATTPLYDTYQSYKKDAEDAVSREVVPPAYKEPVKDYFESIKP